MPGHGGRQGRAQERNLGVPVSHLLLLMLLQLLRLLVGLKAKSRSSRPSGLLALEVEGVCVVLKGRRRGTTVVVVVRGQRGWGDGAETAIVMILILSNGKRVFYPHLIL